MAGYEYPFRRKCSSSNCPKPDSLLACVLCKVDGCVRWPCNIEGNRRTYCRACFNATHQIEVPSAVADAAKKRWANVKLCAAPVEQSCRAPEAMSSEVDSKRRCEGPRVIITEQQLANLKLLLAASSVCSSPVEACNVSNEAASTYSVEIIDHILDSPRLDHQGGHLSHTYGGDFIRPGCVQCKSKIVWGSWLKLSHEDEGPSRSTRVLCAACYGTSLSTGSLGHHTYTRTHVTDRSTNCLQKVLKQYSGQKIEVSLAYQPLLVGSKDICFSSTDIKVCWHCLQLAWPHICNI